MKRIISLLLVIVSLVSVLTIGASAASKFTDVEGHWGQSYVDYYTEQGVVNGYPDGTFRPDEKITRAEAAQILLNYFKFTGKGAGFPDVPESAWYYDAVLASQQNGAFQGYEDGTFKPANNITREEVIVMLRRITTAEEDLESGKHFIDYYDVCDWAKGSVGALRNVGVLDGYEEIPGTFYVRVHRLITRAEFVKLLFTIEKSPNVDWDVPGTPVTPPIVIIPGGPSTPQKHTYYNVAVSISGPDVNNGDTPATVGPIKRYSNSLNSTHTGSHPLLFDVYDVLVSGENAADSSWNYTDAFQTAFGNNLARCILEDMIKAYDNDPNSPPVKAWTDYVNNNVITVSDPNWIAVFSSDIAATYETAVGTNTSAAADANGYEVTISFETPSAGAESDAYTNNYSSDDCDKTYTVTITIYSINK